MPENTADLSTQDGNDTSATTSSAGDKFEPIMSQDDLNSRIADRISRERSKYADYKDLKAKAGRLDELEAANKSEVEKAAEKAADAERERDEARAEALQLRVATTHGITDPDDISLFLTGTDEETLTKQAQRLTDRATDRKKQGNHVAREGTSTDVATDNDAAFARSLLGSA